jgi:hypothetical protein
MVNSIGGFVAERGAAAEKLRVFNYITELSAGVGEATRIDFLLTMMHFGRLDSVKGATNGN